MSETENRQSKDDASGGDTSGADGGGADGGAGGQQRAGGKLLRRILIGVVAMLVVLVAAPAVYLQQAGGITGIIEAQFARQLARSNQALSLTLGDTGVELRLPAMHLTVTASDVTISGADASLTVPEASAVFTPAGLLAQRPFELVFSDLQLDLTVDPSARNIEASPGMALLAGLVAGGASDDTSGDHRRLVDQRLRIDRAALNLRHVDDTVAPVSLVNINAVGSFDRGTLVNGMASAERVVDEGPAGRLEVATLGDPLGGTFNLDVAADNLLLDGLIAYAPVSADILPFSGKISGRMNAAVRDSNIAVFDLEAAATGGSLALPEPFRTIDYKTASMIATYHRDGGTLTVAQSEIVLNDGRILSVQGNIAEIDSAVPVITGRIDGNDLSLDSFYADWPDTMAPQAKTMLQERFSGGQLSDLGIGIAAEFDRAARRLNILTLDLTTALSAVGVDIGAAQYERLQGTGDGTLSLRVGAGGVIQELSVAMGASNATLTLAGREAPLQVGRVQASGALQNNGLAIEEVSVNLANGGAISVSGLLGLGPSWTLAGGSLSLSANNMDARDFHDIWPNWAVSRTRNWVGRKIRSGRVEDVRLDLVSQRDENRLKVRQIDGSITVRDVEMALGGGVPVMTGIDGRMTIADNTAEIILTEGDVSGLGLETAKVTIIPVIGGKPPRAVAELNLSGDMGDGIAVATSMRMIKPGKGGYDATSMRASGQTSFDIVTRFPVRPRLTPDEIGFEAQARVTGGVFENLPFGADARDAEATITASRGALSVAGSALLFGLPSDFRYDSQRNGDSGAAKLTVATSGPLDRLRDLAGNLGIVDIGGVHLADVDMRGTAELALDAAFPTGQKLQPGDIDLGIEMVVSDGTFGNLPVVGQVQNAELVANFDATGASVSGSAEMLGVSSNLLVTFDDDTERVSMRVSAQKSAALADMMAARAGIDINGTLAGSVELNSDLQFGNVLIDVGVDFSNAGASVPAIGWAKLPGEPGTAAMTLELEGGRLHRIRDITVTSSSLSATGEAQFNAPDEGPLQLRGATFRDLVWPGNDIQQLTLSTDEAGDWRIAGNARLIDLVPLRRNRGLGEGRAISFEFLADRIIAGDGIVLSGQISGSKRGNGGGEARFSGDLFNKTKPLITEAQVDIQFGENADLMEGVGLVGGAQTSIRYADDKDNPAELVMTSDNGGSTLKGLGVTDTIRSGELVLKTRFVDGYANFDTNIRITNFRVIEAPRAVRAFSVLGPAGLIGLLEGEGTYFGWGEAIIENRGPQVRMKQVVGQGQAVSVTFVGEYDRQTRTVDVSGNLVPASFLSNIIGVIPLVGQILTGVDKAGLFVTQFSLKGDIDDPDSSVTPASIIPGVLRDILSPSWLEREGERILGPSIDG